VFVGCKSDTRSIRVDRGLMGPFTRRIGDLRRGPRRRVVEKDFRVTVRIAACQVGSKREGDPGPVRIDRRPGTVIVYRKPGEVGQAASRGVVKEHGGFTSEQKPLESDT